MHRHRRPAAVIAAFALSTTGLGLAATSAHAVAGAPPQLELGPPATAGRWAWVPQVEVTDDALYFTTGTNDAGASEVWVRTLDDAGSELVVGPAVRLGAADGVAADGTTAVWVDPVRDAYVTRAADGTTTTAPRGDRSELLDLGDGWTSSWYSLFDPTGAAVDLLALSPSGDDAPWAGAVPSIVYSVATSGGVVAWELSYGSGTGTNGGTAVVAAPLVGGGLGTPVVLDARPSTAATSAELFRVGLAAVSEETVVWHARNSDLSHSELRWVSTADLGGEPAVLALANPRADYQAATDDEHLVVSSSGLITQWDLGAPGTPVRSWGGGTNHLDVHGDVLVWATVPDGPGAGLPSRLRVADLTGRPVVVPSPFSDVPGTNPFAEAITWVSGTDVAEGYADGTYRPTAAVSRQAMAAFLYRMAGEPGWTPPTTSPFADVAPGAPFYAEITWLAHEGLSTGTRAADGSVWFKPAEPVSRQAMAAFLHRIAGSPVVEPFDGGPFEDVRNEHAFATPITWMSQEGISQGTYVPATDTRVYLPLAPVSRQAMAAFLERVDARLAQVD